MGHILTRGPNQGVHIPNFGRFTWETYKTHARVDGKSVWKRRKRPVFLPTDAFVRAHGIRWKPPVTPPELEPCEEINFTRLAIKSARCSARQPSPSSSPPSLTPAPRRYSTTLTKDFAFSCIRDVIQRLGTAVGIGRVVAVEFAVGHLLAKEAKLRFVFGPEVEEEGPQHYRDGARASMLRSVTVGAEAAGATRPATEAGGRPSSQASRHSHRPSSRSSRLSDASDAVLDRSASQRMRPDSQHAPSRRSRERTSRGHSRRSRRRSRRGREESPPSPPHAVGSPLYEVQEVQEEEEGQVRGEDRPGSETQSRHERSSAPGWAGDSHAGFSRSKGATSRPHRRRSRSRGGHRSMDDAASNPWAASAASSPYAPKALGAGSPPVPNGGVEYRMEALAAKQARVIESAYSRHRARVAQDIEEDAHEEEFREQALQEAEMIARDEREARRRREREVREQQERQAQERRRREEEGATPRGRRREGWSRCSPPKLSLRAPAPCGGRAHHPPHLHPGACVRAHGRRGRGREQRRQRPPPPPQQARLGRNASLPDRGAGATAQGEARAGGGAGA